MAEGTPCLLYTSAVTEDDNLIAEYTTNYKKTHSQTLLPMLDEVKKMIELDVNTIDAIAVSAGPGSFTGLRIGSATAKGLGLALNKPLICLLYTSKKHAWHPYSGLTPCLIPTVFHHYLKGSYFLLCCYKLLWKHG